MRRIVFFVAVCMCAAFTGFGQDYSRRGLMDIKEQSEAARLDWNKAFDQAVETKNFKGLAQQRQGLERYMESHLNNMRRLMAQGDARALLTALDNYLQIQQQYLKNVMIPAESLDGNDAEAIAKVHQQTVEFMQKEKIFLMDINNALAIAGQDDMPPAQVDAEMEEEEEAEEEEVADNRKGAVIGDKPKARKKARLPHEVMDEDGGEPEGSPKNRKQKGKQQRRQAEEIEEFE